jgi:hypothetical protein
MDNFHHILLRPMPLPKPNLLVTATNPRIGLLDDETQSDASGYTQQSTAACERTANFESALDISTSRGQFSCDDRSSDPGGDLHRSTPAHPFDCLSAREH